MASFNDWAVAAQESNPLISQMDFIHKPQVGARLFDVNPLETDIGDMMRMGLMKEVKGEAIVHHEANRIFEAPTVNASTTQADVYGTAGGGDPTAYAGLDYIQLAASSHSPDSGPLANLKSYPRIGQHIEFANGGQWRIQGKRETVAAEHRLYLAPINASVPTLANTITLSGSTYGGDRFSVFTNSWEEATEGQQIGLVPTFNPVTSYLQSFDETYIITDFAERDETYPLKWKGKTINFVYVKGLEDTEVNFAAQEEYGLFLQQKDDGSLTTGPDTAVQNSIFTTHGYLPTLEDNAPKLYYNDMPTLALFDQMVRLRKKLFQGTNSVVQYGQEFGLAAKDIFTNFGKGGSMVWNNKNLDLNVVSISIAGYTFQLREMKALSHPSFTGVPGFSYPWQFIVAPDVRMRDGRTGKSHEPFCCVYKRQVGGGARGHYKIWQTEANAPIPTSKRMRRDVNMHSRKGMKVVGATKFIYGKRAS